MEFNEEELELLGQSLAQQVGGGGYVLITAPDNEEDGMSHVLSNLDLPTCIALISQAVISIEKVNCINLV